MVASIGEGVMFPLIDTLCQRALQESSDWRMQHATFMVFAQVGEYCSIPQVRSMVPKILKNLKNQHPMIRYSAIHAIGQLSEDMSEDFS
jgi:hypothetical protein